MSPTFCSAFAYAIEPSERMFAATAAFTGAARLAFTSDIASRSVSSRPISASSSALFIWAVVFDSSVIALSFVRLLVRGFPQLVVGALAVGELLGLFLLDLGLVGVLPARRRHAGAALVDVHADGRVHSR